MKTSSSLHRSRPRHSQPVIPPASPSNCSAPLCETHSGFQQDKQDNNVEWKLLCGKDGRHYLSLNVNGTRYRMRLRQNGEDRLAEELSAEELNLIAQKSVGILKNQTTHIKHLKHLQMRSSSDSAIVNDAINIPMENNIQRQLNEIHQIAAGEPLPHHNKPQPKLQLQPKLKPLPQPQRGHQYKDGHYYFENKEQLERIKQKGGVIKSSGTVLNPLNWRIQARSLIAKHPEWTSRLKFVFEKEGGNPSIPLDGPDDLICAAQGSELPQQAMAAIQATLLYPFFLPILKTGYDGACEEASEAREAMEKLDTFKAKFEYYVSSKLAITGMGGMWWGILLHELEAIANAFELTSTADILGLVAEYTLAVSQAAMALYGICITADGIHHDLTLAKQLELVQQTTLLKDDDKKELLRQTLESQLRQERTLNGVGKIGGGILLTAGQIAMILGGAGGMGVPLVVPGALLTCIAIGMRVGSEIQHNKRFGYHLEEKTWEEIANCIKQNKDSYQNAIDALCKFRKTPQEQLVWFKLFKHMHDICKKHPNKNAEERFALLKKRTPQLYIQKHQAELKDKLHEIVNDSGNETLLKGYLENTSTLNQLLKLSEKIYEIQGKVQAPSLLGNDEKLDILHGILENENLKNDVCRKLTKQFVLKKNSRKNIKGKLYEDYLKKETIYKDSRLHVPLIPKKFHIRKKRKTVYMLELNKLLEDAKNNPSLANHFIKASQEVIFKEWKYKKRSEIFVANHGILSCISQQALKDKMKSQGKIHEIEHFV